MLEFVSLMIVFILILASVIKQYVDERKNKEIKESKIDEFCNKHYKKIWLVFVVILFVTVIYKFGDIPTYVGVDEAGMAYDALNLAEYGTDRYMNSYPLYLTNFGTGQSSLCAYLVALCIKLFGANMISYRLPTLLIYLMSVIVSYLLISKAKNRKMALLFTFLIITCPWNISNARMALDCNLYAGLFMLDLYLLDKAKKNYQFFIAGISIGITLYTYSLSWISLPIFLAVWAICMLYIKRVKFRQVLIMGIPIAIFAFPLIYFLLLNFGVVDQTHLGIFTLPILPSFGAGEVNIMNWFRTGGESLKTIFFGNETIYLIYVPLFIIGYVLEFRQALKEIKKKEYGISTVMVIAFTTLLVGLLLAKIPTPNKANVLYIPILYFVTSAILYISKNSRIILSIFILLIIVLCIDYEHYYYSYRATVAANWFEDIYLMDITEKIESDEEIRDIPKYVMAFTSAPHIYNVIGEQISPEEYMSTITEKIYPDGVRRVTKVGNYNYAYYTSEIKEIDLEKDDYIFIISYIFIDAVDYLQEEGFDSIEYGNYYILTKNKNLNKIFCSSF